MELHPALSFKGEKVDYAFVFLVVVVVGGAFWQKRFI